MREEPALRPLVSKFRLALLGALLALATLLLAGGAAGRELEPGAILEGFPFAAAASVAISADGQDVYATGRHAFGTSSPGLVWLKRDPDSGALAFRRNYLSAGAEPEVLFAALGPDQNILHILTPNRLLLAARGEDGALSLAGETALPESFTPFQILVSPLGSRLGVLGRTGNTYEVRFYDRGLSGTPVFRQTVPSARFAGGAFLTEDLFLSDRLLLRHGGGAWTSETAGALAGFGYVGEPLASPGRSLFYVPAGNGVFPLLQRQVLAFELQGGQLVEVGRSPIELGFNRQDTAQAIDPQSGDLLIATYDTANNSDARIERFRATGGGRNFVHEATLADPYLGINGEVFKYSLAFSPDGHHLYANFGGEPLGLLEKDAAGALGYRASAAGLHSHLTEPVKIVTGAPGEAYLLTPTAVLQTGWDGAPALRSSLELASWTGWPHRPAWDLVLSPGGGAGVLASFSALVMIERDAATGELRFLPESTRQLEDGLRQLAISPDGRFVYVLGRTGISVFELRRAVPELAPVQVLPAPGATLLRLSDGGSEGLLLRQSEGPLFLHRDPASGELAYAPFLYSGAGGSDVVDALFSRRGRLLHLFRSRPFFGETGQVEVLSRQPGGVWRQLDLRPIPQVAAPGLQLVDAGGNALYQLSEDRLELSQLVNRHPAFELKPLPGLDRGELRGVGAEIYPPLLNEPSQLLALLPGDGELLIAHPETGNVGLFHRGCGQDLEGGPCLAGQRFRLEVLWEDASGAAWPARVSSYGSNEAQIFSFFDLGNWEMMVKVLDGCAINDRFWVFAAASTDVAFEIRVTDTFTGERRVYDSPAGAPSPAITDGSAFATCGAAAPGWTPTPPERPLLVERPDGLELGERFVARATWRTASGQTGSGTGLRTTEIQPSGLFYFFSPDNWEVQLKVLDGCAINGYHWVLGAATTDVGYELEVFDPVTGLTRTYRNPVGNASPAILDLRAFPCA